MRGDKVRLKARFMFGVQKWPVLESDSSSLAKKPCPDTRTERCQVGISQLDVHLPVSLALGRRKVIEGVFLTC